MYSVMFLWLYVIEKKIKVAAAPNVKWDMLVFLLLLFMSSSVEISEFFNDQKIISALLNDLKHGFM